MRWSTWLRIASTIASAVVSLHAVLKASRAFFLPFLTGYTSRNASNALGFDPLLPLFDACCSALSLSFDAVLPFEGRMGLSFWASLLSAISNPLSAIRACLSGVCPVSYTHLRAHET